MDGRDILGFSIKFMCVFSICQIVLSVLTENDEWFVYLLLYVGSMFIVWNDVKDIDFSYLC